VQSAGDHHAELDFHDGWSGEAGEHPCSSTETSLAKQSKMSTTLIYRLPGTPHRLPDELKRIIDKKFGLQNPREFSLDDRGYIEGLADAGVEGAEELLGVLDKHGMFILEITC
jgi:hypothetical protein